MHLESLCIKGFKGVVKASKGCFKDSWFLCSSDEMRNLWQIRVNTFLSVWNKLRRSLDTNGECAVYALVITGMAGLGGHSTSGDGRLTPHYPLAT